MLLLPYNTYTDIGFLFLKDTYPAVLYWKGTVLLHITENKSAKVHPPYIQGTAGIPFLV